MTFEPTSQRLAFILPMPFLKGDLLFRRVNHDHAEVHIPVEPAAKPRHVVSTAQLAKGRWRVYLNWSDGRQQYHAEKDILIT